MSWLGHTVAGRGGRPAPAPVLHRGWAWCVYHHHPLSLPGTPPWHSLVGEDLAQGSALGSDREGLLSNPADTTGLPAAREAAGPGRWARQVSPAEPRGLSPPEQLTGWAEVGGRAEKAFRLQESPHFSEPASLAACLGVRGVQKALDNGGQMELRVCWT